jgi:hypothetical protein
MLRIRQEQLNAFAEFAQGPFESAMLIHLRAAFPKDLEPMRDSELLALIRDGIKCSAAFAIITEGDVQRFLEYMVMYGSAFDSDPAYAWAGKILRTPDTPGRIKMNWIDEYDEFVVNRH